MVIWITNSIQMVILPLVIQIPSVLDFHLSSTVGIRIPDKFGMWMINCCLVIKWFWFWSHASLNCFSKNQNIYKLIQFSDESGFWEFMNTGLLVWYSDASSSLLHWLIFGFRYALFVQWSLCRRKYTPLYEKGIKKTQNKSMETSHLSYLFLPLIS